VFDPQIQVFPGQRIQFFRLEMRVPLRFRHESTLSFLQREITLLAFVALQRILDSFRLFYAPLARGRSGRR
jgi:hypothetical protein